MPHFIQQESKDSVSVSIAYRGISGSDLAEQVKKKLIAMGYSTVQGPDEQTVYERGNRRMHVLLGIFSKYFRFGARVEDGGDGNLRVRVHKLTSIVTEGWIGMLQVQGELRRIAHGLEAI